MQGRGTGKGLGPPPRRADDLCKQNTKSFWKRLNTEAGGGQETRGQLSPSALSSSAPPPRVRNTLESHAPWTWGLGPRRGIWEEASATPSHWTGPLSQTLDSTLPELSLFSHRNLLFFQTRQAQTHPSAANGGAKWEGAPQGPSCLYCPQSPCLSLWHENQLADSQ